MRTTHRPLEEVQSVGFAALQEALSPSEMAMFIAHWPFGRGNYTEDRHQWLDNVTVEDVVAEIRRADEAAKQPV